MNKNIFIYKNEQINSQNLILNFSIEVYFL